MSLMCGHLIDMFRHNRWANLRILDWCAGLDEALLDSSAPGTFGAAGTTLVHLVGAEERYVEYITGELMPDELRLQLDDPFPGFAVLKERVDASGQRLVELAESTPHDLVVRGHHLNGEPYTLRATTLLIQAIHHAAEHRTHVMTVISQHGVDVPETDGWTFGEEELSIGA